MPANLHAAVRARAGSEGKSVSAYVVEALRRDLAVPSQSEWLARVRRREPVDIGDAGKLVRAERAARDDALTQGGRAPKE